MDLVRFRNIGLKITLVIIRKLRFPKIVKVVLVKEQVVFGRGMDQKFLKLKCFQKEKMVVKQGLRVVQIKSFLLLDFKAKLIGQIKRLVEITIRINLMVITKQFRIDLQCQVKMLLRLIQRDHLGLVTTIQVEMVIKFIAINQIELFLEFQYFQIGSLVSINFLLINYLFVLKVITIKIRRRQTIIHFTNPQIILLTKAMSNLQTSPLTITIKSKFLRKVLESILKSKSKDLGLMVIPIQLY